MTACFARDSGPDPEPGPRYTGCERASPPAQPGSLATPDPALEALAPDAYPSAPRGPGVGAATFAEAALGAPCAFLSGGPADRDHHDLGGFLDGFLVLPFGGEDGRGGLALFDLSSPCAPARVATIADPELRESHRLGFSFVGGRRVLALASMRGVMFWDLSEPFAPLKLADLALPGVRYPDAYARVVLATSWQGPYLYVAAADNGIFVVDASEPSRPRLVAEYHPLPTLRAGGVQAVGNRLVVFASQGSRTIIADLSDPAAPAPLRSFLVETRVLAAGSDGDREVRDFYAAHVNGHRAYYARKDEGGGLVVYDLRDWRAPALLGGVATGDGQGGYVFVHEDVAYVGQSNYALTVDVADATKPRVVRRFSYEGDFDWLVPMGNVALASADDHAAPGRGSGIVPVLAAPDRRGPRVNMIEPQDGAKAEPLTTRIGIGFDEAIEPLTVFAGSVQVKERGRRGALRGTYSVQEDGVAFWPERPLRPGTTYDIVVPAGGVRDVSGNPTASEARASFTTVSCP